MLAALITIAVSLGLSLAVSELSRYDTNNREKQAKQLDYGETIAIINKMTSEARAKGNAVVNKLYDKLQSAYFPGAQGAAVKQYVIKAKRKLEDRYDKAVKTNSSLQKDIDYLEQRSNNYINTSDDYKLSKEGKNELDKLKDEKNQFSEKYKTIGDLEKYV